MVLLLIQVLAAACAAGGDPPAPPRDGPPWLAEGQRPPETLPAHAPKLSPLLEKPGGGKIASAAEWELERARLHDRWLDFLGRYPDDREPPPLTVLSEDRPEGCIRKLVRYQVEPGVAVEAYLLLPARLQGKAPGVVV